MVYKTLIEVLNEFPNVAPIKAKKQVTLALRESEDTLNQNFRIGDCILTKEDVAEIYISTPSFRGETIRTSPLGAKILIDLYQKGLLAMKPKTYVQEPSAEIVNYAVRSESYKKDFAEKARQEYLIDHPNEITEEDFSYYILDNVIYRTCGPGSHSLNIANIEVDKIVCHYKSNSGKSSDCDVTISWTGSDGKSHMLNKPSIYRDNRRSDSNRNWGLGRE